ncbi:RNA-binding protein [Candidatus Woesearchaeota archaeon]|nr:RNA-binding protein [Candidatus Woesearchaeota archaeon]
MSNLIVAEREIVVPGQELAEGMDFLPGDYVIRDKDKLIATKLGMVNVSGRLVRIVALNEPYLPKRGDLVIGKVVGVGIGGWRVDIGWPFEANLSVKDATSDFIEKGADLSKYFNYGDYIMAEIVNVASSKIIDLSMKGPGLRKLGPGRLLNIPSSKVPRVIGKQGSMIGLVKDYTECKISVGQNGTVWLRGEDPKKELLAVSAIRKIELESHISGLTDKIKEYLESKKDGL